MRRLGLLGFAFVSLVGSTASAQTPAPPAGYAVISLDTVLEPLLTAAEADLGRGDAATALARAQIVVASVPSDGPSRIRAEGLVLLAQQRLAGATAEVAADVALAPLVDAAAADAPAGRVELARARLDFVLARIVAASPLATRANAIRAAMDASIASAATPYQPVYTSGSAAYVYTPQGSQGMAPSVTPTPSAPTDPHRRGDPEIAELYVTAGIFGAFTGAWIPYGAGLFNTATEEERARGTTIAVFVGAGVLALGVFGLDQIDNGLRTGVPAGISMGIRYGFGLAALSLGIVGARNSIQADEAFNAMGFAAIGGGLLGAVLTMTMEPHPAQVQFTQASGLWGAIWGANLAMIAAPLMGCEGFSCPNRQEVGFGLVTGGLAAGLLSGMLVSALHANTGARRAWQMTLGLLAGAGAGTALWALISATSNTLDVPTLGGCMLAGSIGGLVIAGLLSSGDRDRRTWDDAEPELAVPSYQVSFAPTQGGGTIGVNGSF